MMFDNYGLSKLPLKNNDYGVNKNMTNENVHRLKANTTELTKRVEQRQNFFKNEIFNKMKKINESKNGI